MSAAAAALVPGKSGGLKLCSLKGFTKSTNWKRPSESWYLDPLRTRPTDTNEMQVTQRTVVPYREEIPRALSRAVLCNVR